MNNSQEWKERFNKKLNTYDKDGGFIVYEADYDNNILDTVLIENFFQQELAIREAEVRREIVEKIVARENELLAQIVKYSINFDPFTGTRIFEDRYIISLINNKNQ